MALTHKRSPAAVAEAAAQQAKRTAARDKLPTLDAYLLIANPNVNETRQQTRELTLIALDITRGVIGG